MKDIRKLGTFSLTYGEDLNKAKAFIGICYGLGLTSFDTSGIELPFTSAIDHIDDDGDRWNTLLIGDVYGIDLCDGIYSNEKNFSTIDQAYKHLLKLIENYREPVIVELNAEYDAIITEEGIEVGCQKISYEKLEEVMMAAGYEFE